MNAPLRLAVSGAGRVFERLYAPALSSVPGLELVAVADPDLVRAGSAGVPAFAALDELLGATPVDAVAVLSPPAHHAHDATLVLERGLHVLVEKPMCLSADEAEQLRAAGAETLLTPALSRRYWPAYEAVASRGLVRELRIAIAVDPAGWGAHSGPADIAEDLFPHVADLARWTTSSDIDTVTARRGARGIEAHLAMSSGATVTARLDVRDVYDEAVRAEGRSRHVGPPDAISSAARRLLRREDPAVQAVARMLTDWVAAVRGARPAKLPAFDDGVATVVAMGQLRAALRD